MLLHTLFLKISLLVCLLAPAGLLHAEQFYTIDEAREALWGDMPMEAMPITLTKEQMKSIKKASKTRVRTDKIQAWNTENGGWYIVDQVVGKHEMIDMGVAINPDGSIKGLKVMYYRETYGDEVKHPKWLAQFIGRTHSEHLKLDKQIDNISGATLSCRHITDGVNRWTHTWDQVLQHL